MSNTNKTSNQKIIYALFRGENVQYKSIYTDKWEDFDLKWYIEVEDPFGPWNCIDGYEWRIKPETTSVKFKHEKTVAEEFKFKFDFEGVKTTHYEIGDKIFYIWKNPSGTFYKCIIKNVNHYQSGDYSNHVFFTSEEYLNKAWEQIPSNLKGN